MPSIVDGANCRLKAIQPFSL